MNTMTTKCGAAILSALVEGNSIASTCRMLGVNKVTILRLLGDAGTMALRLHNQWVQRVTAERVQVDGIWAFCYAKDKNVPEDTRGQFGYGDVWTWTERRERGRTQGKWSDTNHSGPVGSPHRRFRLRLVPRLVCAGKCQPLRTGLPPGSRRRRLPANSGWGDGACLC